MGKGREEDELEHAQGKDPAVEFDRDERLARVDLVKEGRVSDWSEEQLR